MWLYVSECCGFGVFRLVFDGNDSVIDIVFVGGGVLGLVMKLVIFLVSY